MDAEAERQQWTQELLHELEESSSPSAALMDRIERLISSREELEQYTAILTKKVRGQRSPTAHIQDRLERLLKLLEQFDDLQETRKKIQEEAEHDPLSNRIDWIPTRL
jgi:predicted  nucleic acid-binding Zn-ribbon protein